MVYTFQELTEEQVTLLAKWQFWRNLKKRTMLLLILLGVIYIIFQLPTWCIGLFAVVLAVELPILLRVYLRHWKSIRRTLPANGFLTVTEAGVMVETDGLTTYSPWSRYIAADLVAGAFLLTVRTMQVFVWNVQSTDAKRQEELLRFARNNLGKQTCPPLPPPRGEYMPCTPLSKAQLWEMGDMMHVVMGPKHSSVLPLCLLLLFASFTCFNLMVLMEEGAKNPYLACMIIFAYLTLRTLLRLRHPGRKQLMAAFRAQGTLPNNPKHTYCSDAVGETRVLPTGAWLRAIRHSMHQVFCGEHLCVARHGLSFFPFFLNAIPTDLPPAVPFCISLRPFYIGLGLVLLPVAITGFLCFQFPSAPLSYFLWMLHNGFTSPAF